LPVLLARRVEELRVTVARMFSSGCPGFPFMGSIRNDPRCTFPLPFSYNLIPKIPQQTHMGQPSPDLWGLSEIPARNGSPSPSRRAISPACPRCTRRPPQRSTPRGTFSASTSGRSRCWGTITTPRTSGVRAPTAYPKPCLYTEFAAPVTPRIKHPPPNKVLPPN